MVDRQRLSNDAAVILAALATWREEIVGLVVESTYNWYSLVDAPMNPGYGCTRPTRLRSYSAAG